MVNGIDNTTLLFNNLLCYCRLKNSDVFIIIYDTVELSTQGNQTVTQHVEQTNSTTTLSDNKPRAHCFKIQKQYSRVNCRAFSFANRCIDAWNSLDNDVLCASSVQAFKTTESAKCC